MTVAECGGGGEEEVALGSSLFAKGPLQGPSRSAEAGLRSGRAGLDPCGGEGLSLMMEVGWEGWGVDWDGRVDVAPPRCQASCRRAVSSHRTPGARLGGRCPEGRVVKADYRVSCSRVCRKVRR